METSPTDPTAPALPTDPEIDAPLPLTEWDTRPTFEQEPGAYPRLAYYDVDTGKSYATADEMPPAPQQALQTELDRLLASTTTHLDTHHNITLQPAEDKHGWVLSLGDVFVTVYPAYDGCLYAGVTITALDAAPGEARTYARLLMAAAEFAEMLDAEKGASK